MVNVNILFNEPEEVHLGPHCFELHVQILQALKQELEPVVPTQLRPRGLPVKDEHRQQLGSRLLEPLQSLDQAWVVVKTEVVPEPNEMKWSHGGVEQYPCAEKVQERLEGERRER